MTILSNGHLWKHSEFIENKNFSFDKNKILNSLSKKILMKPIQIFLIGKDILQHL
jgi:hypothetical protein